MKIFRYFISLALFCISLSSCTLFDLDFQSNEEYEAKKADNKVNMTIWEFIQSRPDIFSSLIEGIQYAGIEDLYKENSILTKIMILEKSNKYIEIINNVDKIVNKVYDSKLYTQTQKEMLLNILNNTMINIVGNKKMKEYKIKLEGGENMLALYEMIENERNEIYSTGIKEGKVKGKIEGIKAIAKKMLRMKFDKDTIMKATGIKEEELEKMKK